MAGAANRFYHGRRGLVLPVRGRRRQPLPHIYGPLNLDAVVDVRAFEPDENGTFSGRA